MKSQQINTHPDCALKGDLNYKNTHNQQILKMLMWNSSYHNIPQNETK